MNEDKITVQHWHFPQVCFDMTIEELMGLLEETDKPEWWTKKYRTKILKIKGLINDSSK